MSGLTLEMNSEAVLNHLWKLQDEHKLCDSVIHASEDLAITLCGREQTMRETVGLIEERRKGITEGTADRTKTPMVLFSGLPGLGKTRMLEEWKSYFAKAGIKEDQPRLGVIVTYGNGSCAKDFEGYRAYPIEATFSWRLLHVLFLKKNSSKAMTWCHASYLPNNASEMTLQLALEVVWAAAERFHIVRKGEILSLFIGIDEYQKIPTGPDFSEGPNPPRKGKREDSYLWKLIGALQENTGLGNVHIYPAFAGTEFGVMSLAGSSIAQVKRVPLRFLSPREMEDAVRSKHEHILSSREIRRNIFKLGGIPRPSVKYADDSLKDAAKTWEDYWKEEIKSRWTENFTIHELLKIVAKAASARTATRKEKSGVRDYSWGALADQGVCLLDENGAVTVPYCVFRIVAETKSADGLSWVEKCFLQNLKYLSNHVDDVLYDLSQWQLWEKFGACVFAMKVNALQIMGTHELSFKELCDHSVRNGCDYVVSLVPMHVHEIEQEISRSLPKKVTEKAHNKQINWLEGDEVNGNLVRYCLLNGNNGAGVDVFAALPMVNSSSESVLLYCDQRKVVADSLGQKTVQKLIKKATIKPDILPEGSECVRGLFSILASFNGKPADIEEDSFVLSYKQHREFYGESLSYHPACRTYIDVNNDNKSTLLLLTSINKEKVDDILSRRDENKFSSREDFVDFCRNKLDTDLTDDDKSRICGF